MISDDTREFWAIVAFLWHCIVKYVALFLVVYIVCDIIIVRYVK